jgi:SAM-dependent methyltransferase
VSSRYYHSPPRPITHVYDAAYAGVPNWDIGRPQRAFLALADAGLVAEPVLDVGCGTGELALYLARQGFATLGIDLSPRAIGQARAKARSRRIPADFLVWDALDLEPLVGRLGRFGTVLDSAMFHILAPAERERFVAELVGTVRPGGRYCLLGDRRRSRRESYGITPEECRSRFGDGWELEHAVETSFERRGATSPAYLVVLRRR